MSTDFPVYFPTNTLRFSNLAGAGYHTPMDTHALQTRLLDWYRRSRRYLPWRGETDPYKIWVSEVMLQQTRVETVIPYYRRFVTRFPTLQSLAAASLNDVLKAWEGLGYYARARNLHRAAQKVVAEYGGLLPRAAAELRTLPGFGEYTAGAVASIAFGEPVPAVDGNVTRVLSRLFAVQTDITTAEGRRQIRALAAELARAAPDPAGWNQALMELGALLCTPAKPRCLRCPAAEGLCRARSLGLAESLPVRPARKAIPHYHVAAGVIYRNAGRTAFLIARRPPDGMLGGLWEFPGGKQQPGESLPDCLRREIREELAMDIAVGEAITTVRHAFSHFRITLHAFDALHTAGQPQAIGVDDWAWVTLNDLHRYPFPHTDRQIIAALRRREKNGAD